MSKWRKILLASAALALMGSSALISSSARADILLGVAGPMSGEDSGFGEQYRHGAEMAVADLNAKGGLLGQKLVIMLGDDGCTPKQAVAVANMMAAKHVSAVIGHFCSSASIAASGVYAENDIPQISPGSTSPALTERGLSNVFRVCGRDDAQAAVMARYIRDHANLRGRAIAVVSDKTPFGRSITDLFIKSLRGMGTPEALFQTITAGEKDFSPLIDSLKASKAELLFFGGYPADAAQLTRQLKEKGLTIPMLAGDSLATTDFWTQAGEAGNGTLFTFNPDPRQLPSNSALVQRFRDSGFEPEFYTLYSYAAVQAWAQAVTKAGSTSPAEVEKMLKTNSFPTVLGPLAFDVKGDATGSGYVVYMWKNGKFSYAD